MRAIVIIMLALSWPLAISAMPTGEKSHLTEADVLGFIDEFHLCWSDEADENLDGVGLRIGFRFGPNPLRAEDVYLVTSSHDSELKADVAFNAARNNLLRCQLAGGYPKPSKAYDVEVDVIINLRYGPLKLP